MAREKKPVHKGTHSGAFTDIRYNVLNLKEKTESVNVVVKKDKNNENMRDMQ